MISVVQLCLVKIRPTAYYTQSYRFRDIFCPPPGYFDLPGAKKLAFLDLLVRSNWETEYAIKDDTLDEICSCIFVWMLCECIFHPYCLGCSFCNPKRSEHTCMYGIARSPEDYRFVSVTDYIDKLIDVVEFNELERDFSLRVSIAKPRHSALFSDRRWSVRSKKEALRNLLLETHRAYASSIDTYEDVMVYICTALDSSEGWKDYFQVLK